MITEEQRQNRRLGIGGSDMPIILGLSNYKTPYQLYLEKLGILDNQQTETPAQYWGNKLEPLIIEEFAKRNNVIVEQPDTIVHPVLGHLRANVDGYIKEWDAVLEVKCATQFMAHEWGDIGSDVIPMPYLVQVAHYCAIMNAKHAYIAVLIGGCDYREFYYQRDMKLEEKVIQAANDFWSCVKSEIAPGPIDEDDLRLMFPKPQETKVILTNDTIKQSLAMMHDAKQKIKQLTEIANDCKFSIMKYLEDAECLVDENGIALVSYKANKKGNRVFLIKGDVS